MAEAEFRYSDLLPTGADDTPYRLITTEGVSAVEGLDGQQFLKVAPEAIQQLTAEDPVGDREQRRPRLLELLSPGHANPSLKPWRHEG